MSWHDAHVETNLAGALANCTALKAGYNFLAGNADSPEKLTAATAAVSAYCRQRSSVEVADILASITDLSAAVLDAHVLPALVRDGSLKRTSQQDRCAVA